MQLVDQRCAQVLADRCHAAAEPDVESARRIARLAQCRLDAVGDEMEDRATFPRDRRPRMMRQYEHRDAIRGLVPPPALPALIRPRATHGAEHVAAEYPRADVRESPRRTVVVRTGFAVLVALHVLPRSGVDKPVEQLGTADAQRMLQILVRSGAVAVDRYRERVDAQFRQDVPFGLIAIQC